MAEELTPLEMATSCRSSTKTYILSPKVPFASSACDPKSSDIIARSSTRHIWPDVCMYSSTYVEVTKNLLDVA